MYEHKQEENRIEVEGNSKFHFIQFSPKNRVGLAVKLAGSRVGLAVKLAGSRVGMAVKLWDWVEQEHSLTLCSFTPLQMSLGLC